MKKNIKIWKSRLVKTAVLGPRIACETTPFVLNDRLYRLENHPRAFDFPLESPTFKPDEDEIRIREVESDRIISTPLRNHYFASGFVWDGRFYIFATPHETGIRHIVMLSSEDLINWTTPQIIITAKPGERFFNTAVCRGKDKFVMIYETNDKRWIPFTFIYCESDDLVHWTRITNAVYGKDKYVGGPSLYYEGGVYYTLYVNANEAVSEDQIIQSETNRYETRITRSSDLVNWEDAPVGRPFVSFNENHRPDPEYHPDVYEINASDAELCYWKGKTLVYFNGGNQQGVNDLQLAEFNGTPRELLEHYYE
ncbi:MAG: hypothetical protein WCS27_17580 [Victivallaceae bacterium]